jgi:hypothetical protein
MRRINPGVDYLINRSPAAQLREIDGCTAGDLNLLLTHAILDLIAQLETSQVVGFHYSSEK